MYSPKTVDELESMRSKAYEIIESIDYLSEPVSYDEFFHQYLLPNKLCVLGTWATEGWRSRKDWVNPDGTPNLHFLKKEFGSATGPIANCNQEEYASHPKSEMTLAEFIDYLEDYKQSEYPQDKPCLYLKDWHFVRLFPQYQAYTCPQYFSSDWLNEFWDTRSEDGDDYRFVYFGPKGSWTSFHADVFSSHSWSANICGQKKWIFYPPGEEDFLRDKFGQIPFDLTSDDLRDCSKFPRVNECKKRFEIIQNEGEVVFVPSGWHHQVFNLVDTISINHNWINACNIDLCWRHIKQCLRDVQKELDDVKHVVDWDDQCQILLKATSGIDYAEFYLFVLCIAKHRFEDLHLARSNSGTLPDKSSCDKSDLCNPRMTLPHIIFDLAQLQCVLKDMVTQREFSALDLSAYETTPHLLCESLESALKPSVTSSRK